jgi:hypothetical protein
VDCGFEIALSGRSIISDEGGRLEPMGMRVGCARESMLLVASGVSLGRLSCGVDEERLLISLSGPFLTCSARI